MKIGGHNSANQMLDPVVIHFIPSWWIFYLLEVSKSREVYINRTIYIMCYSGPGFFSFSHMHLGVFQIVMWLSMALFKSSIIFIYGCTIGCSSILLLIDIWILSRFVNYREAINFLMGLCGRICFQYIWVHT